MLEYWTDIQPVTRYTVGRTLNQGRNPDIRSIPTITTRATGRPAVSVDLEVEVQSRVWTQHVCLRVQEKTKFVLNGYLKEGSSACLYVQSKDLKEV